MNDQIQKIGQLIRSQDNRATSDPIFIVQQERSIWGVESDFSDDFCWFREEIDEYASVETAALLDKKHYEGKSTHPWIKRGYLIVWEFVTACFTEKACQEYIDANGHNLTNPRIYAASAYRNAEFIAVRQFLINQTIPTPQTTPVHLPLELAFQRWTTVSIRWNDLSSGFTPELSAFLAGWFSRSIGATMPTTIGQFRDSFVCGWDEADAQITINSRIQS